MKKLYITFTLILSSFFLFNYNVKADTYSFDIIDNEFNHFTEDFYKLRELAISNLNEEFNHYIIVYNTKSNKTMLRVYFFNSSSYAKISFSNSQGIRLFIEGNYKYYYLSGDNLIQQASGSGYNSILCRENGTTCTFLDFLDTNFNLSYSSNSFLNISYNDLLYEISLGVHVPSLYEIYLDSIESSDPHKQEKEVLSNFYSLIFEKIDLLSNSILSNYIYLTIIVIFILIFLIQLIRRYLL